MIETLHGTPRSYETIGRLLTCLLDYTSLARTTAVRGLHVWPTLGGGCAVEWTGGPHAAEVLQELEALAADDDVCSVLSPGDITGAQEYGAGAVRLHVRGIPFSLRPVDTVGIDAMRTQVLSGVG